MKRLAHWEDLLTDALSSGGAFGTTSHSEFVRLVDALRSILRDIDRELAEIEAKAGGGQPEKS
jgi:hypothetical protein